MRYHHVAAGGQGLADGPDDGIRVFAGAYEVQHSHQEHTQWLAEVDKVKRPVMSQDRGRVAQVRLDHRGVPAGLEGARVGEHHRIVVHVDHPGVRVDQLGDLMNVALRWQPGPDVQELDDARLSSQVADSPAQELAVLQRHQLYLGYGLAYR